MKDMETCVKHKVPIIITSLRPPQEIVDAAHSYGGVVFHDVINVKHARKAAEQGVDGLILVCAGAGGHAGTLSPFALLREVKPWFKGTILLSGAISDGWSIASALALGADLAYMGTRFIATAGGQCAELAYKQALTDHAAHDIVYSNLFTGVHGNYLGAVDRGSGSRSRQSAEFADKTKMNFGSGGNTKVQGVARHLGLGSGYRPDQRRAAGRRTGGPHEGRVRRKPATTFSGGRALNRRAHSFDNTLKRGMETMRVSRTALSIVFALSGSCGGRRRRRQGRYPYRPDAAL